MTHRRLPLRLLLPLVVVIASLLLMAVILGLSYANQRRLLVQDTEKLAQLQTARLVKLAETRLDGKLEELQREIVMLQLRGTIAAVAIADPAGKVLHAHRADWQGGHLPSLVPGLETLQAKLHTAGTAWQPHWIDRQRMEILVTYTFPSAPDTIVSQQRGRVYLQADIGDLLASQLRKNIDYYLILCGAVLLLAAGLYLWLKHALLRPLQILETQVERIGAGQATTVTVLDGPQEITQLAEALRVMAAGLQESQAALRQSEQHHRSLFENSHTVMLIIDPADGRIVDANPKAESYYGYARDKLLTMCMTEINTLPPAVVKAEMARAQTEQRHQFFFKHRLASGLVRDVEVFSGPLQVEGQKLLYSIVHDITEKRQLEEANTHLTRRALQMLSLPELADTLNEVEFMQRGLEIAETLTESEISFIHFVNDDEESIELVTWSRRTLEIYCHAAFDRHYPVSQAGIWAEAVHQHRAVVFNDYANEPTKHGLPEGHSPLQRLISLPVIEHGKVVMLAGIGNKPTDYLDRDVETLQLIANEIWRYVQRGRNQGQIERFSRLIERSQNEIYSFDAQTLRFIDVNHGACSNIGYRLDELRQMTPLDIKPEMTAESFEQMIAPLRAGQASIVGLNTVHRRKNGSTYPVEIMLEMNREANPVFVAVARDVTERHRTERALLDALQIVEASPIVHFRVRATSPLWPIEYVSPNISRWGYAPEDLTSGRLNFIDLIHADDLPRIEEETARDTQDEDQLSMEYRMVTREGNAFWVDDSTRIVRDRDGKPLYYECVISDIDAKKRYEQHLTEMLGEQLALNKKLEDATHQLLQSEKMASVGQLAAGVAHELNNPIGFVNSNLGSLENYLRDIFAVADAYVEVEKAVGADCPQLAQVQALKQAKDYDYLRQDIFQLMAESKDGLDRVAKIVKDLKDFSRAGDSQMHWADLHQGLDSTLNVVWNELKYKCEVKKEYGSLPQVWCESSQINQVFMNLLVNAGHAIAERGTITLRTGQQGEEVFVAISDSGCGIPPDQLSRIFEPFFTTKPVGKGTGLGLSLAYGIVQKHQGRIEVESTVGQGTTFTVWLPIEPAIDQNTVPINPAAPADAVPPAPTFSN